MSESVQQFGGNWTEQKLTCLRKYLQAYTKIFKGNPRAKFFTTIYLDAFAGTGYRANPQPSTEQLTLDVTLSEDELSLLKGSARIALEVKPGFNRYIFVERDPLRVRELERLRSDFPEKDIQVEQGDANEYIWTWTEKTNWEKWRAVVFLDPYGMQVKWETIQRIAATRAIDLWLLFPAGIAVNRLLTKDKLPPDKWAQALTEIFGSDQWRERFYKRRAEDTLFGTEESVRREADLKNIGHFFIERLETAFGEGGVLRKLMVLRNSRKSPMYLLCFACGNPKAKQPALRIADDLVAKYSFAEYLEV
ncbi:MAG: three-Cys-motif partner protein TcmP [Thermoflexales bacterium]